MSVIVTARVRSFIKSESDNKRQRCVEMQNNAVILTKTKNQQIQEQHQYQLDKTFWSFDGFSMANGKYVANQNSRYSDQEQIYNQLGKPQVDNAFEGYHSCLFAYGPTGTGKSYTMVGKQPNLGIIGLAVRDMYQRINDNKSETKFEVQLSMMEVYNDNVHDLLKPFDAKEKSKENLEVLQEKHLGFYVRNLNKFPIGSINEMEDYINLGFKQRTIAATSSNQNSSRAHTIVQFELKQTNFVNGAIVNKLAYLNFVDLAGSETLKDKTNSRQSRENKYINESLSYLCTVLRAIKHKYDHIPYRSCQLTKILTNSLGGNSKTVMICCLSPSDCQYAQTKQTLEIAQTAMGVVNNPIRNEIKQDWLIAEIEKKQEELQQQINVVNDNSREEIAALIEDQNIMLFEVKADFQEKMQVSQTRKMAMMAQLFQQLGQQLIKATEPYLMAINEDDNLVPYRFEVTNGLILGSQQSGTGLVGGLGVQGKHIQFHIRQEEVYVQPCSTVSAEATWINGEKLTAERKLADYDRIIIGNYKVFVLEMPNPGIRPKVTYQTAEQEIYHKNKKEIEKWEQEQNFKVCQMLNDQQQHDQSLLDMSDFLNTSYPVQAQPHFPIIQRQSESAPQIIQLQTQQPQIIQLQTPQPQIIQLQTQQPQILSLVQQPQVQQPQVLQHQVQQPQVLHAINQQPQQISQVIEQQPQSSAESKKALKFQVKIIELNKMTQEMGENLHFEFDYRVVHIDLGKNNIKKEVTLIAKANRADGEVYEWNKHKFNQRYQLIKTLYDQFQSGASINKADQENNPFYDIPLGNEVAYCILPFKGDHQLPIKLSQNQGFLTASIQFESIAKQEGDKIKYQLTINNLRLNEYKKVYYHVQYSLLSPSGKIVTHQTEILNCQGKEQLVFNYAHADKFVASSQLVNYFNNGQIHFRVFGSGRKSNIKQGANSIPQTQVGQPNQKQCTIF